LYVILELISSLKLGKLWNKLGMLKKFSNK
jgi:hypothetical protein